ncbi:MAG: hypothetical protein UU76_C0016G0006 [Parcubacteria group bacterium GW2011_GWC1_41_7]|nr:MAG: hypothetical protein UU76_C0016G0006 [Parcubacteria group bacterium GW2011_GWC1_41_7]
MRNFLDAIPKKLVSSLIVILLVLFGIGAGLSAYAQYLERKTTEAQNAQDQKLASISASLTNRPYKSLIHFIALKELITNKKSVESRIQSFSQVLPHFLKVSQFSYNSETGIVSLTGSVSSVDAFLKLSKYLNDFGQIKNLQMKYSIGEKGVGIEMTGTF